MAINIDLTPRVTPTDYAAQQTEGLSTADLTRALHARLAREGRRGQADAVLVLLSELLPEVDRDRLT